MRNEQIMVLRNRAIKERFKELKNEFKNNRTIITKMVFEFWLTERTIKDILYLKKDYRSQQKKLL